MRTTILAPAGDTLRFLDSTETRIAAEYDAIALPGVPCRAVRDCHAVSARNVQQHSHHSIGEARCVHCGESVGTIRVDLDTIFGREEDAAVLHGRPRVY